jgi:F-type H+-transporting ATPase subunit b
MRFFVFSSVAVLLFMSSEAAASGASAGHGIPWGDIFKHAVNLALLLGVLIYFTRKPFSSFLKERSELIRKSIDDAAAARAEAMKKLEEIDARMATLSEELEKLNSHIQSEANSSI